MEVAKCFLLHVGILIALMASSSHGYVFYVGGRDGWELNPSENYTQWSGRNRFQVNDTLVFRYRRGEDSVLRVTKEDFDACNVTNPLLKMDGGDSMFVFDQSGPFYFVSGVPENCDKGQKLLVVVMAVRNRIPDQPPSTPPANSPASSPFAAPPPHAQPPSDSSSGTVPGHMSSPPSQSAANSSTSSSSGLTASRVALGLAMGVALGVFMN